MSAPVTPSSSSRTSRRCGGSCARRWRRTAIASSRPRTAAEAVALATSRRPELILLDLGLPDGDGSSLTRRLREWSRVPIIVISARGREADKVAALDAGADDYLTKPFGVDELLARIRVALRHARAGDARRRSRSSSRATSRIDLARRGACWRGGARSTSRRSNTGSSPRSGRNAGRVLTHRQILKEVWGPAHADETHYLRVYMAQLRRKIEETRRARTW